MESIKKIRIEELVGEVQRVPLDVHKGDEHVDHVQRGELDELVLEVVLHNFPELKSIGRVEVKGAKGLTDCTHLGRVKPHMLVYQVLSNTSQDVW